MKIQEAAKAVGCTPRAIKFYEEKGLLPAVARGENQYRSYSQEDLEILHTIHAYRKLGIGISDIRQLLSGGDKHLLHEILAAKRADAAAKQEEIRALEAYIQSGDAGALNASVDFESLSHSIQEHLPGSFGRYLAHHFAPYLSIRIQTEEQQDAYARIVSFWENPSLRLPLLYRVSMFIEQLTPPLSASRLDAVIQSYLHPTEEVYEQIKKQTLNTVRMRRNPLFRFSPGEVLKRKMMRALKDCGYYDVFLPQMERLSPPYQAYREAMQALDAKLCEDLGLHYDSDYHLVIRD